MSDMHTNSLYFPEPLYELPLRHGAVEAVQRHQQIRASKRAEQRATYLDVITIYRRFKMSLTVLL